MAKVGYIMATSQYDKLEEAVAQSERVGYDFGKLRVRCRLAVAGKGDNIGCCAGRLHFFQFVLQGGAHLLARGTRQADRTLTI